MGNPLLSLVGGFISGDEGLLLVFWRYISNVELSSPIC